MRLTAGANAAYKGVSMGALMLALALVLPLILFFIDQDSVKFAKLVRAITLFAGTLGVSGLWMLFLGVRRLGRTLKHKPEQDELSVPPRHGQMDGRVTNTALPPPAAQPSVTEVTTNLLPHEIERLR